MKMKRVLAMLAACAMLGSALTGCASYDSDAAVTDTVNVTFTATPSKKDIKVETENGTQKLELVYEKGTYDPTKMVLDDYNFDGYTDIAFPVNYNEKNIIYQLFLYNPDNGQFEKYAGFSNYYGPTLDKEKKQLKTEYYADAYSTAYSVYDWRDGELFCLEVISNGVDEDGNKTSVHMVYNEETGTMELVEDSNEAE